jgi:hypothetical protein
MGFDLHSFRVLLDAPSIRRVQRDPEAWETAVVEPPFSSRALTQPPPAVSRELLTDFPDGLDRTNHFQDRSFQQAEYLLGPAGYRALTGWPDRERSLPFRRVHGDQVFADHARGTQGVHWRCSTAAFLADAADLIDATSLPDVRGQFSVADMAAGGIYKVRAEEDDDAAFARILANLRQFSRYCREVADSGMDLILILD